MKKEAAWWEKLGKPQYGGEIVIRGNRDIMNFDPYFSEGATSIYGGWLERLVGDDWTMDPEIWSYRIAWHPTQFRKGVLAESWEFPDPATHIVHLRKGVRWQNIAPANGREFTADDVVFHYNRMLGLGAGYTKPSPARASDKNYQDVISVTAADKYTVVFKFKTPNPEFIMETIHEVSQAPCIENPEAVREWGDVRDWRHAIGTGPFILKDCVSGGTATLVRNSDYWGFDERYPQNKLPYADKLKFVIIPDEHEAVEAMRAGKVDIIQQVSAVLADSLQKTNPEIIRIPLALAALSLQPRNDRPPFNDLRVRRALQMAIDLPEICKSYYKGTLEPYPSTLTPKHYLKGWGFPYEEWPQDLKDEYAYNPSAARNLLAEAGYPRGFKTHVLADTDSDLDLLQIVKSYFADIGVDMEIQTMGSNEWLAFVESGKHDQLVYRPYGPLGNTYSPLRALARFQTGLNANFMMVSDPVFDGFYPRAMAATNEDQLKLILKEANDRVARQHYAISLLQPLAYSLCQPWLKGYHAQVHSVWMGSGGPSMLSFYAARFWIDQKIKQSFSK